MINSYLYTIGYGNRTSIELFHLLKKYAIDRLIDVRAIPYSRFYPMFNKNRLAIDGEKVNVKYIFKGFELGAKFGNIYPSYDLLRGRPEYLEGLQYLIQQLEEGRNIAIMCCESDHHQCHRYSLIGEDMYQLGYNVVHIDKRGELILHEGLIL